MCTSSSPKSSRISVASCSLSVLAKAVGLFGVRREQEVSRSSKRVKVKVRQVYSNFEASKEVLLKCSIV